jgi:uncharacterized protein YjbI with pentapeptide repeats
MGRKKSLNSRLNRLERWIYTFPTWIIIGVTVFALSAISLWVKEDKSKLTLKEAISILFADAESIAIVAAVILYFIESPGRREQKHYEAFQVIDNASGTETSYARFKALQDLNNDDVSLIGLDAPGANLKEIVLIAANLRGSNLREANLSAAQLRSADLSSANFRSAFLISADLSFANLSFANLSFANLRSANLTCADLSSATLNGADLISANLSQANLSDANLTGANLSFVNLGSATLRSANLSGCDLRSADFHGADLTEARYTQTTLFPEGFDPGLVGMTFVQESVQK